MKTVRVSDEVYSEIARRGRFGESVDDVLLRELHVSLSKPQVSGKNLPRIVYAQRKMTPKIVIRGQDEFLQVSFERDAPKEWLLPAKNDRDRLRAIQNEALHWATNEGGTEGQLKYIRKELNDGGYYVQGPRR
jgi:hypothetical protein